MRAEDRLRELERIVGGADWQSRAATPQSFANFCAELDRVIDIDSVDPDENHPDSSQIGLVQTCAACPEQYNAYLNGQQVGYLRLRHGHFTVRADDPGGPVLYSAKTIGDGIFEDEERDYHLGRAKTAIVAHLVLRSWENQP